MDRLNTLIDAVNAFAWGPPMLGMLGVTGVLLTLGLLFMPWRKVGYGFRLLFAKDGATGEGEVKPFNALMTALSATVGTGNIAGVATAIALGGPGAIFYMWLIALFGHQVCGGAVTYRRSRICRRGRCPARRRIRPELALGIAFGSGARFDNAVNSPSSWTPPRRG